MNIRYGSTDDAQLLSELGVKTFYAAFAKDNTPEDIDSYLRESFSPQIQRNQLSDPSTVFLIAESEDIPIGYAQLVMDSKNEFIMATRPMEIRRIYVTQEYIGKGVGKELMDACIQEAKQKGCTCVWLGVWEKNQRAIDFYMKRGFRKVGTQMFLLGSDPQNDFVMELELT